MTFRIALVGSGNISDTHARAVLATEGAELAGCWSRNADASARLADRYGTSAFPSLDDLLAAGRVDGVMIGTPSGVHGDAAIAAARRGVHVLVEKPLETTSARVDQVLDACAAGGVTLGVIFQDRTATSLRWLHDTIAAGMIGTSVLASASVRWYRPPDYYASSRWRGTRALDGGGALMNQGIHTVDLLLWLMGPVTRVSAVARTALHRIEVEDTVVATLEFASGAVGTLEVTTAAWPGLPRRLEVSGSEGTVVVEGDRVTMAALARPGNEPPGQAAAVAGSHATASASSPVVADVAGHQRVLADFIAAVCEGRPPLCDGEEGRRSVALVEAIYRSAAAGCTLAM